MGWDLTPSSMEVLLTTLWRRYAVPLLVTESGIADGGEPDTRRVRYMAGVLTSLREAMRKGAHVRGYMYWSLMDNFEWAEGYWPRFGLYRVDYESDKLPRKPTKVGKRKKNWSSLPTCDTVTPPFCRHLSHARHFPAFLLSPGASSLQRDCQQAPRGARGRGSERACLRQLRRQNNGREKAPGNAPSHAHVPHAANVCVPPPLRTMGGTPFLSSSAASRGVCATKTSLCCEFKCV